MNRRGDHQAQLERLSSMLDDDALAHLVSYARFMVAQRPSMPDAVAGEYPPAEKSSPALSALAPIEDESVVGAVRRLRRAYSMLDPRVLLGDVGEIMTLHATDERSTRDAITALEEIFASHYERYRDEKTKPNGISSD